MSEGSLNPGIMIRACGQAIRESLEAVLEAGFWVAEKGEAQLGEERASNWEVGSPKLRTSV
jgi:hypothetical protein